MKHILFRLKSMLKLLAIGLVFIKTTVAQTTSNSDELPYTLTLDEITQNEIPGLHSFAFGKHGEWWVIIGGRTNGLHGFFINTGFPEDKANTNIRLINPLNGEMRQFNVESLNIPFKDALKSTNMQYVQDGDWLYLCGGYGKDIASNKFTTFPVLTAVYLPTLVNAVVNNQNPTPAIRQKEITNLAVCGGEMDKLGDWFYLVGGHNFSGLYNQNGPPQFSQTYSNEIRKFKILNTDAGLSITNYSAIKDEENLHRRDFSLAPLLSPDGKELLGLYGGVFRVGVDLPYYNPVYISEDQPISIDAQYSQLFSQYTCPVIPMFDTLDGSMYSLFFGGLSVYTKDPTSNQLIYDEKVPFIKDITSLHRKPNGTTTEYVMPQRFDQFLGTNMIFVPADDVPRYTNEVIKLRALNGPKVVGYLFGGIKAEIPNLTPSVANNRIFSVTITPKTTSGTDQSIWDSSVKMVPNILDLSTMPTIINLPQGDPIQIYNTIGQLKYQGKYLQESFQMEISKLSVGTYWLKTKSGVVTFFIGVGTK